MFICSIAILRSLIRKDEDMDEKELQALAAVEPEVARKFAEFERECRVFEAVHPGTATLCPKSISNPLFAQWRHRCYVDIGPWFLGQMYSWVWLKMPEAEAFVLACTMVEDSRYHRDNKYFRRETLWRVMCNPWFAGASDELMTKVWNAWVDAWKWSSEPISSNPWNLAHREIRQLHEWPTGRLLDHAINAVDSFMQAADHAQVPKPRLREMRKAADGDWSAWLKVTSNGNPPPLIRQRLQPLFRKHVERWALQARDAKMAERRQKKAEEQRKRDEEQRRFEEIQRQSRERESKVTDTLSMLREVMRQSVEKLATEHDKQALRDMLRQRQEMVDFAPGCSDALRQEVRGFPNAQLIDKIDKALAIIEQRARENEVRLSRYREHIGQRVRQIVTVFNGLFDLAIDPEAVLNGTVTGEYASIHSAPRGSGVGLRLQQSLRLTQELHVFGKTRTWLELEEGDSEDEMLDAYETANFITWHELSHLVSADTIKNSIEKVASPPDLTKEQQAHAREVVLDALAFRLGSAFYVHQSPSKPLITSERARLHVMRTALACMARRVIRHLPDAELDANQEALVLRLHAELKGQDAALVQTRQALRYLEATFEPVIQRGRAVRDYYAALLRLTLKSVNIASASFRGSLHDTDEDPETFAPQHTLH